MVTLNVALTPIISVFNIASTPTNFTTATVSSANGDTFVITDPYNASNTVSTNYSYTVNGGTANPGLNFFTDPSAYSLSPLVSSVPAGDLGSYSGSGAYALGYASTSTFYSSGSPGISLFYGGDATLAGTATVTYTFSPVPTPASLGAGLVLMTLLAASIKLRRKACPPVC